MFPLSDVVDHLACCLSFQFYICYCCCYCLNCIQLFFSPLNGFFLCVWEVKRKINRDGLVLAGSCLQWGDWKSPLWFLGDVVICFVVVALVACFLLDGFNLSFFNLIFQSLHFMNVRWRSSHWFLVVWLLFLIMNLSYWLLKALCSSQCWNYWQWNFFLSNTVHSDL